MNKEIFCTLGPASLNDWVVTRFQEIGINLFRLNLSHTKLKDLAQIIQYLHSRSSVPVCLDTEGAQVRTGNFVQGKIYLKENSIVNVHRQAVPADSSNFNLYPSYIVDMLEVGDFITVDSSVLVKVIEIKPNIALMQVLCGGEVGQNKAVTVERDILMPAMTEKDLKALAIGKELGIRHVALSFAHRASDVDEIRKVAGGQAFVISKIECRSALKNVEEIALKSDALLIDRGDLSRQVPIEQIPAVQKHIITTGKKAGRKVYVATNLMESRVTLPAPTRAEVNDVFNTLADGADGVVLAAESAIGQYPVDCANMMVKIIHEFTNSNKNDAGNYPAAPISLLVEPHGGHLVERHAEAAEIGDLNKLKTLVVNEAVLADCEQIAHGVYSPLTGFMGRETLESVLKTNRLPNGLPWPIPILLQVDKEFATQVRKGERLALKSKTGRVHAVIEANDIYALDLNEIASQWFGTTSRSHPGVAKLLAGSDIAIGGDITLVEGFDFPYAQYKLTPAGARYVFAKKGWTKVVGYYAHSVLDRAHEFVQTEALQTTHADGLFINIMTGPRIPEDIPPELIYKSYRLVLDFNIYPSGKVLLGCSPTYLRYAGPREAIFAAICCKNMGCEHIIIDRRDYPDVEDVYKDKGFDARRLFDQLSDIGVKPLFYDTIGFDTQTQKYRNLGTQDAVPISNTEIVETIRQNKELPELYMREIVQEMLRGELVGVKRNSWDSE